MSEPKANVPDQNSLAPDVHRVPVPGGWLYIIKVGEAVTSTFAPDPKPAD